MLSAARRWVLLSSLVQYIQHAQASCLGRSSLLGCNFLGHLDLGLADSLGLGGLGGLWLVGLGLLGHSSLLHLLHAFRLLGGWLLGCRSRVLGGESVAGSWGGGQGAHAMQGQESRTIFLPFWYPCKQSHIRTGMAHAGHHPSSPLVAFFSFFSPSALGFFV